MPIPWLVDHPCTVKREVGGGDVDAGSARILGGLRAEERAALVRKLMAESGRSVLIQTIGERGKVTEREADPEGLDAEREELRLHEPECDGCPARARNGPFGCFGSLPTLVPERGEAWLMARLGEPGDASLELFLKATRDFRYYGLENEKRRKRGFFEAKKPVEIVIEKRLLRTIRVDSDQLFHGILDVGPGLEAGHCLCLLVWLRALSLDGRLADTAEAQLEISRCGPGPRVGLEAGEPDADPAVASMQELLRGFYAAWTLDAPFVFLS